jgi:hypothetical protein
MQVKPFWDNRHLFSEIDGVILKGTQIVIPKFLRPEIMTKAHTGHLRFTKTKTRAREVVWWPKMTAEIDDFVSKCDICAKSAAKGALVSQSTSGLPLAAGCNRPFSIRRQALHCAGGLLLSFSRNMSPVGSPYFSCYRGYQACRHSAVTGFPRN